MPSWCSLLWGWSETAFILVVAVNETLLPLKNTLAANNQEGQDERKPTEPVAGDSDSTADEIGNKVD